MLRVIASGIRHYKPLTLLLYDQQVQEQTVIFFVRDYLNKIAETSDK
jgi:hypothetical protein